LVLAPRFIVPSDLPVNNTTQSYLQWEDVSNGPWRYGANSIQPVPNISSFHVMDAFMKQIHAANFANLEHIAVAGHSSGGQFVQRWTLLSSSFYFGSIMTTVVANPSSFAYLTPLRYNSTNHKWSIPHAHGDNNCPAYNRWEWGLEPKVETTPDYVQAVLQDYFDDTTPNNPYHYLIERFAERRSVYLQGSQDRCNVSSTSLSATGRTNDRPWCQSHDLETTCQDELQGRTRFERSKRYMEMLALVGATGAGNHVRLVVPMVGHDHSLMFASPQGLQALFHLDELAAGLVS